MLSSSDDHGGGILSDVGSQALLEGFLEGRRGSGGRSWLADLEPCDGEDPQLRRLASDLGQLLKDDRYLGDWGYADAADLARKAVGEDPFGYRAEAVRLIDSMQAIDG